MVDDNDADIYRRRLSEVLRRHGFGWVVDQAEIQIAEGKPSSKQVSERESFSVGSDPMFAVRAPRRRRASLITSEPYTEEERLEILIGAIDAALVQRANLETAVLDVLGEIHPVTSITFQPASGDLEDSPLGRAHSVDPARRGPASIIRLQTERALKDIRERERAGS